MGFALVVLGAAFILAPAPAPAEAGAEHNMSGWAWSSNIGWISFNCTNTSTCGSINYGVSVSETSSKLSGYAWSPNIGWISFNESDLSGCPQGSCQVKLNSGKLNGWARALAGRDNPASGWDGWISLDKKSGSVNYAVTLNDDTDFEGYAWGSDVVGWILFNPSFGGVFLNAQTPVVSLTSDPTTVPPGSSVTLSWTSQYTNSCTASGGTADWPGEKATSGSQAVGPISATTIYDLSCTGIYGTTNDSVTVNILPPDFFITKTSDLAISFLGDSQATSDSTTIAVVPQYGFSDAVALSATPATINGEPVTYIFSDASLSSSEYSGGSALSVTLAHPVAEGVYAITVQGVDGGYVRTVTVNLTVNTFEPGFEEF